MLEFVFRDHFRLAADALLLFAVGLFISWPVVRYRLHAIARPAEAVFRLVVRLMGPSPAIPRIAAIVFCYNSAVMFVYMACGFHPMLPRLFSIWTGMNIGVLVGMVQQQEEVARAFRRSAGQWTPGPRPAFLCGLLVLVLELPCFWFAIAMGISMGHQVQGAGVPYLAALAVRARAYASVIMPMLLISATAEAIAIRGAAPPDE